MNRMRALMLLVAVLTGLALAGLWWQADRARTLLQQQAFDEAEQRSLQLADAMAGQIDGLLSSLDTALLRLRRDWLQVTDVSDFALLAQETLRTLPEGFVDYVSVVDASGHVVYNSLGAESGVFVGDRPHFRAQRAAPQQMLVGTPVQSRLSGRWVFIVSRAVLREGVFDGTVHLLVSTEHVARRLAALSLRPTDIVSLVHPNGDLLAHSANNTGAMSRKVPADRPFLLDGRAEAGTFRFESPLDARWRTAGWRRLPDSGLVTVVGLSDEGVLAPLQALMQRDWVFKLLLSGLFVAGGGLIMLLLGRVGRSQALLETLTGELEQRVQARTRDLAMLNAELESFAYSVAHDLRTPLRSIHGFASLLEEDQAERLDDTGRSHLRRIQAGAKRMGQLITDLLSMTQLGRATLKVSPVDLSAMATDIASELDRNDPRRRVEWQIEEGLRAEADPVLVRAVLQNLLGNAWKYTGQNPQARISLRRESTASGLHTFVVQDNGAGFDMAFVQQLFQPFRRLHAHDEFEGSGVGLATVKRIVERHGGSVGAEGVPGQGAKFRFSLPQSDV
ncbi:MAG TPA: ATP-binding protein [Hydrogenophaga sp.]|uniref:sensor histidine kinase n=2 Tax=Hydrogenophaga sp. TaxID=1904254 RepID=UPI002C7FCC8B|nr:ATP-binding protein [Hydrogenophaga sp.]HMN92114.1 ATP-binding protein [Hydrogenophaga sp.]HMP10518.1 ATP-binding protein [Hydrogenophaga sp.]